MRFVDTNVLLYAISKDAHEQEKTRTALTILNGDDLALSIQVLQEFYVQSTRRTRDGALSHEQAVRLIEAFLRFRVQEMTLELMQAALASSQRFRLFFWDASILEAARASGCDLIFSEDLSDGQDYGGVKVRNPFRKTK